MITAFICCREIIYHTESISIPCEVSKLLSWS